jgi:hypothetical protein
MTVTLVPGAVFTRLPHGGGVVVNGSHLTIVEVGEPEAELLDRLVTGGLPADLAPASRTFIDDMVDTGWLLIEPSDGSDDVRDLA